MRRLVSYFLVMVMLMSQMSGVILAETTDTTSLEFDAEKAANDLHDYGLFKGVGDDAEGNPIYELDREPTRVEAITMLVRLLGKEKEAQEGTWTTPFTDVPDWAKQYVGYAYTNGLTKGIGETTFGSVLITSATQYLTFTLRALGYESEVDFQWDQAWVLSDELGITSGNYREETNFLRGHVAMISLDALAYNIKGTEQPLYDVVGIIPKGLVFDKAGIYGPETDSERILSNVTIEADGVILQNYVIEGDLVIAEAVGEGDIYLNNVVVVGTTYIRGGGSNSIHINGGQYTKVVIERTSSDKVRIVAFQVDGMQVVISEDAAGEEIVLEGNFEEVNVEAGDVKVETQGETNIKNMVIDQNAAGVSLNLGVGTRVDDMQVDTKIDITGQGEVIRAAIEADGVTFEKEPEKVVAGDGVTYGEEPVEVIVPIITYPSSGGGSVGSTSPITPAAPAVVHDDNLNTVVGMTTAMEYKLDAAGYVAYSAASFNNIDFSGAHTLLVRVSAEGINPAGAATTLIFTERPIATTISVNTYAGLKAALESENYITIDIDAEVVIPVDESLNVTVEKTLVVNGKIIVSDGATLSNSGTIESSAPVAFGASVIVAGLDIGILDIQPTLMSLASESTTSTTKIEVQGSGQLIANKNSNIHFDHLTDIITPSQQSLLLYSGAKIKIGDKQYLGKNSGNAMIELSNYDGSNAPVAGWFLNGDGELLLVIFERATVLAQDAGILDIDLLIKGEDVKAGEIVIPNWQILSDNTNGSGGGIVVESNGDLIMNGTSIMSASDSTSVFNAIDGHLDNRRGVRFTKDIVESGFELMVNIRGDVTMNKALSLESGMAALFSPGYFGYNDFHNSDLRPTLDITFEPAEDYFTGWYWDNTTPAALKFEIDANSRWIDPSQVVIAIDKINDAAGVDSNTSSIIWADMFNTGAENLFEDKLSLYKEAIASADADTLGTISAIQSLVDNVTGDPVNDEIIVSGIISLPGGEAAPAEGMPISVDALSEEGTTIAFTNITMNSGESTASYELTVPTGDFIITYNTTDNNYVSDGYYNATGTVTEFSEATVLNAADTKVTGIDLTIVNGYKISGTVSLSGEDVAPAGGLEVYVHPFGISGTWVTIPEGDSSALYEMTVPEGDYIVRYVFNGTGYLSRGYYNNIETVIGYGEATSISVLGENISDIDITLIKGVKVSGIVSQPDGDVAPTGGMPISVDALSEEGTTIAFTNITMNSGESNASYELTVPTGDFIITYNTTDNNYVSDGYYNATGTVTEFSEATVLNAADTDITGKDITIVKDTNVSISGTVSLPEGDVAPTEGMRISVDALSEEGSTIAFTNITMNPGESTASYELAVPTGGFIITYNTTDNNYVSDGYYNATGTVTVFSEATTLNAADTDITAIDLTFSRQ